MPTRLSLAAIALLSTLPQLAHVDAAGDEADPRTALALSIVGTAIPVATIGASVVAGKSELLIAGIAAGLVMPAAGELYAHCWVTRGMALRGGAAMLALTDLLVLRYEAVSSPHEVGQGLTPGTAIVMAAAGALYLGGVALDVYDAPSAARSRRRAVAIAPTMIETPAHRVTGLAMIATF
jgi:hypothetical protein